MVAGTGMGQRFDTVFTASPLIAILRGIAPDEVLPVADALMDAGFRLIEVPLNSPEPFESIGRLVAHCPADVLVGAGTVLDAAQVTRLAGLGASLVVTPNTDTAVIDAAVGAGLATVIGCFTPSEALLAVKHGAAVLKVFPAGRLGPAYLRDIRPVLPAGTRLAAVGGVGLSNMADFLAHGADGFGFGSDVYTAGRSAAEVGARARDLVAEYRRLRGGPA